MNQAMFDKHDYMCEYTLEFYFGIIRRFHWVCFFLFLIICANIIREGRLGLLLGLRMKYNRESQNYDRDILLDVQNDNNKCLISYIV